MPPDVQDGDLFLVWAYAEGTAYGSPSWLYMTYDDGTSPSDGFGEYGYSNPVAYGQNHTVLIVDAGTFDAERGRHIKIQVAPVDINLMPSQYVQMVVFAGAEKVALNWETGGQPDDNDVSEMATQCRYAAERSAWWIHLAFWWATPLEEVEMTGGRYLALDTRIAESGVAPIGTPINWRVTEEGHYLSGYVWIVAGLLPVLDLLTPQANDVAGAVGSGRYPIR